MSDDERYCTTRAVITCQFVVEEVEHWQSGCTLGQILRDSDAKARHKAQAMLKAGGIAGSVEITKVDVVLEWRK